MTSSNLAARARGWPGPGRRGGTLPGRTRGNPDRRTGLAAGRREWRGQSPALDANHRCQPGV